MNQPHCIGKTKNGGDCCRYARIGFSTCDKHEEQEPVTAPEPEPEIRTQTVQIQTRTPESSRAFWPEGKDQPSVYVKRAPLPCKYCRRVLLPNLSQAVIVKALSTDRAYLYCKACQKTFTLPIVLE